MRWLILLGPEGHAWNMRFTRELAGHARTMETAFGTFVKKPDGRWAHVADDRVTAIVFPDKDQAWDEFMRLKEPKAGKSAK